MKHSIDLTPRDILHAYRHQYDVGFSAEAAFRFRNYQITIVMSAGLARLRLQRKLRKLARQYVDVVVDSTVDEHVSQCQFSYPFYFALHRFRLIIAQLCYQVNAATFPRDGYITAPVSHSFSNKLSCVETSVFSRLGQARRDLPSAGTRLLSSWRTLQQRNHPSSTPVSCL